MTSLSEFVDTIDVTPSHPWSWANYRPIIEKAISHFDAKSVLEMGGGRMPLFKPEEITERGLTYVINDIDQSELDLMDPGYKGVAQTMCADITQFPQDQTFDLIISKMVYEHVKDNRLNLHNQLQMLNPGGMIIHFHPVLYSFPFVVNWLMPVKASRKLMDMLYGKSLLKFPAYYDRCRATPKAEAKIRDIGYDEVQLIPIWGHAYYRHVPPLHRFQAKLSERLAENDARALATYCFTMARKAPETAPRKAPA